MLARTLLEWCDNKTEEVVNEKTMDKAVAKRVMVGAVEGFVDGAVVVGGLVCAIGLVGYTIGRFKK